MNKKILVFLIVTILMVASFGGVAYADDPLLNLQLYLIDSNSNALPGYIVTIDNDTQSIANTNGVAAFAAVNATRTDTFKVFTPDKKQVGACNLSYQKSDKTSVGPAGQNGGFTINYSTEDATIYVYLIVDPNGNANSLCHPGDASDNPLNPGKKPSPSPSASSSAGSSQSTSPASPTPTPTNPEVRGYVIDEQSLPEEFVTVVSKNIDTGSSVSGATDTDGYYTLPGMSEGRHIIEVYQDDSDMIGDIDVFVETGAMTGLKDVNGDGVIDIHTGTGMLYLNMQVEEGGSLKLLDVSEHDVGSPARHAEPVPEPTAEPVPDPTAEPVPEPTDAPTPEPGPVSGSDSGIDSNMMIIIIVAIIAAAAVIIVILVLRSRRYY